MARSKLFVPALIFFILPLLCTSDSEYATVVVRVQAAVAETYDNFICATIDWWPPEKCNFGHCPWGLASALNLDLSNPLLLNAVQAFNPLRIRIGGSLQDQVDFEVPGYKCRPFEKKEGGLFGFSAGCLPRARWDQLNLFFQKTGAVVTFGLNALSGRSFISGNKWGGPWNSSNARELIKYTISKGYPVDSWELGNELSGRGIGARVDAWQYAEDMKELRRVVDRLYVFPLSRPLLVAPGGFFDKEWYTSFLQLSGPYVADVVSHHLYSLGPGDNPKLVDNILNNRHLDYSGNTFRDLKQTILKHGAWASTWVSEAGGSHTSGGRHISDTFINSLWYLDEMAQAAKSNTKTYCRQSLMGGNYGLLDLRSFKPNPDYYSALLWHRLMGSKVLDYSFAGPPSLRVYAHCAQHKAGITLLFINLHRQDKAIVTVRNDLKVAVAERNGIQRDNAVVRGLKRAVSWVGKISAAKTGREEYHLSSDGDFRSKNVLLNGRRFEITEKGDVPNFDPLISALGTPVAVPPLSIVFAVFPNLDATACQ
ncbi:heparanase-like protein 1 isoform X2 [Wolffia australiana]